MNLTKKIKQKFYCLLHIWDWNRTAVDINTPNTIEFQCGHPNIKGNSLLICDKFNYIEVEHLWSHDIEGIGINPTKKIQIRILKSKLETPDANGLKKYLQANPVTIYYQLDNPVTEKLSIKDTLQAFENGYIQLDNAITPVTQLEYSTNIPSALGGLTQITDKLVDDVTNVEITISDMDAEIGEARKDKNTLEERLEEDRTNILNTIGQVKDMSLNYKTNYEGYDNTKIYTWTKMGTYITNQSGVLDLPNGWNQGRYEVVTFNEPNNVYNSQIIFGDPYNKKMAFRYCVNENSKWIQLATVDDIEPTKLADGTFRQGEIITLSQPLTNFARIMIIGGDSHGIPNNSTTDVFLGYNYPLNLSSSDVVYKTNGNNVLTSKENGTKLECTTLNTSYIRKIFGFKK